MPELVDLELKKIPIEFNAGEHVYKLGDRWLDGVTTVLRAAGKPWLAPWAVKEAAKYLEDNWKVDRSYDKKERDQIIVAAKNSWTRRSTDARGIGTEVHDWISTYVQAPETGVPPLKRPHEAGAWRCVDAYLDWRATTGTQYLASELIVCDPDLGVAGTLDALILCEGKIKIADVKTSAAIYDEYWIQCAAYECLYRSMRTDKSPVVQGRGVLRLDKDSGVWEWMESPIEYQQALDVFLNILGLHRYNQWCEKRKETR